VSWSPVITVGIARLAALALSQIGWLGGVLPEAVLQVVNIVIPVQLMQALPYILTVVILAGFVGRAIPPRAGGEPYVKER